MVGFAGIYLEAGTVYNPVEGNAGYLETIVVGRNGAGKSNFLDTMRFTAEALQTSVDHALRARGGIAEVCHRGVAQRSHFGIRLDFRLADALGWYAFDIGARDDGGYVVRREECRVRSNGDGAEQFFRIVNGRCAATALAYPPLADSGSLFLVRASSVPEFRPVFGALANMVFYQIDPRSRGGLQAPGLNLTSSIMTVVEGNGEVQAVPVLLRRIVQELAPARSPVVLKPIRVPRSRFIKEGVLEAYVGLAAQRVGVGGGILILLGANGACPARLGPALLARARRARPDRRIEAVLAKCEYEAWAP